MILFLVEGSSDMDAIMFDLVVKRLQGLCNKPGRFSWVKSVTKDPSNENDLLWQTEFGDFTGRVGEEEGYLVFQIGKQELVIQTAVFLGEMRH